MKDIERMRQSMEMIMAKSIDRVDELMAVRDVEFPEFNKRIKTLHCRLTQTNKLVLSKTKEDRHLNTKRFCLQVLT